MRLPEEKFMLPVISGDVSSIIEGTYLRTARSFTIESPLEESINVILSVNCTNFTTLVVESDKKKLEFDVYPDFSFIYLKDLKLAKVYLKNEVENEFNLRLCIGYKSPMIVKGTELIEKLEGLGRFRMQTPAPHIANLINKENYNVSLENGYIIPPLGLKEGEACNDIVQDVLDSSEIQILPQFVSIESTGYCNLTCVHCPQGINNGMPYPPKPLDSKVYENVKDVLHQGKEVVLNGYGEPLASPQMWKILDMMEDTQARCGFNTNGHLLNDKNIAKIINSSALKFIHISLDAATPVTYERIRGDKFSNVISNVRNLVTQVNKANRDDLSIKITMVLMRENLPELDKFIQLAAELGVPAMIWNLKFNNTFYNSEGFKTLEEWNVERGEWKFNYSDSLPHKDPSYEQTIFKAIQEAKKLNVPVYGLSSWPNELLGVEEGAYDGLESQPKDCVYYRDRLFITSNGDVRMCCYQIEAPPIDSVLNKSLEDVWNGKKLSGIRDQLASNKVPGVCSKATCIYVKGQ